MLRKNVELTFDIRTTQISFTIGPRLVEDIFGSLRLTMLRLVNFEWVALGLGAIDLPRNVPAGLVPPNSWQQISAPIDTTLQAHADLAGATLYNLTLEGLTVEPGSRPDTHLVRRRSSAIGGASGESPPEGTSHGGS